MNKQASMHSSLLKKLLEFPRQPLYVKGLHNCSCMSKYQRTVVSLQSPGFKGCMQGSEGRKQREENMRGREGSELCYEYSTLHSISEHHFYLPKMMGKYMRIHWSWPFFSTALNFERARLAHQLYPKCLRPCLKHRRMKYQERKKAALHDWLDINHLTGHPHKTGYSETMIKWEWKKSTMKPTKHPKYLWVIGASLPITALTSLQPTLSIDKRHWDTHRIVPTFRQHPILSQLQFP